MAAWPELLFFWMAQACGSALLQISSVSTSVLRQSSKISAVLSRFGYLVVMFLGTRRCGPMTMGSPIPNSMLLSVPFCSIFESRGHIYVLVVWRFACFL